MLRFIVTCFALLVVCSQALTQVWTSAKAPEAILEEQVMPMHYHLAQLASRVHFVHEHDGSVVLPMPDGSLQEFLIEETSNFHPGLAARYPSIKSYLLQSPTQHLLRGRLTVDPQGFHAVINHLQGEIYIDPVEHSPGQLYMCYYTKDYRVDPDLRKQYAQHQHFFEQNETVFLNERPRRSPFARNQSTAVDLTTYRFALACTGEYAKRHDGTVAGALAAMNVALDRINFVLESELSIHLELIENNDSLIHLDADTDPYTNGNARQMGLENNNHLIAKIGSNNFDVGHVFGTQCSGVVGVSGGVGTACGGLKGFGSSCEISTTDRFYIGIVCHELGHQFGAQHTWNNCPTSPDDQFNSPSAFEPGSGSTIMSYAGACGDQNVQDGEDFYYHVNSLERISNFVKQGSGSQCGVRETSGNMNPVVEIRHPSDFYIPVSTPFKLTAMGSDPDGDEITYSWEQYDAGIGAAAMRPLGAPMGNGPIFRSAKPTTTPHRYFPSLQTILSNGTDITEVLPTYDRDLTFRATVRDHQAGGGGIAWDELSFKVTEQAGPFAILEDALTDTLVGGAFVPIAWDVAGTDGGLVNCKMVNILLSTDGGLTYGDTLLRATANDGEESVVIPNLDATDARIMVQAADNIFFDVNNESLAVMKATEAGFGFDILPHDQRVCIPTQVKMEVNSFGLGTFNDSITLSVIDKPAAVTALFPDRMGVGDPVSIDLDLTAVEETTEVEVTFLATSTLGDSALRTVRFSTISSDFFDLQLQDPSPGSSGHSTRPSFAWTPSNQAEGYNLEVATSPAFAEPFTVGDLTQPASDLAEVLEENTLYYWRIQPYNRCGVGDFTSPETFHTVSVSCDEFMAEDLPKNISQSVVVPVESSIQVTSSGVSSDVNISAIQGFHESFGDLTLSLIGPAGQSATLVSSACGFSNRSFTFGFDDESNLDLDCQSNFTGQIFKPAESLDSFIDVSIEGAWTLRVVDSVIGSGGRLESWSLEVCGTLSPTAPVLASIDTLTAQFADVTVIDPDILETIDDDANADALLYTLVMLPNSGMIRLRGEELQIGDQFTQSDIDQGSLEYLHHGLDSIMDSFSFTVIDQLGGWIPTTHLPIEISTSVSTYDLTKQTDISLFPNPATDRIFLRFKGARDDLDVVRIFDIQGKMVFSQGLTTDRLQTFDIGYLNGGIYIVQIIGAEGAGFLKMVID